MRGQRGYLMITLMFVLALITIGLLTVLPEIGQQIKRDREEEMRHRGTAYMRAIQHFYKKFGRYPSKIEDLESTNNLRFLRKRYTDPLNVDKATGKEKDFKFLHQQDITLNNGPVLGQTPGLGGLGGQAGAGGLGGLGGQSGFGGQGGPQGPGGFGGALGGGLGGPQGGLGAQPGGLQPPGNSGSGNSGSQTPGGGNSGNSSDDGGNSGSGSGSGSSNSGSSNSNSGSGSGFNGPTFGGGPILGVASTSKAKSIRVFYDKNHYNDWLFVYLPQGDRGGLLVGPVTLNGPPNPNLGGAGIAGGVPGGVPGQGGGLTGLGGGLQQGLGQGANPNPVQPQSPPTQAPQN